MPIFEYICRKCHHHFEVIVTGSKKANCPKCESRKLDQQFSRFGVSGEKGASATAQPLGRTHTGSPPTRAAIGRERH